MSNLKIGTLCIWKGPRGAHPMAPPIGTICEVVDGTLWASQVRVDYEVVEFPRHPGPINPYWQVRRSQLVPISGPDIDITEECTKGDIVHVGETT